MAEPSKGGATQAPEVPILSRLRPAPGSKPSEKRIGRGRGSGLGKTSGRGQKGQKARRNIAPRFEGGQTPLQRRLPKVGFHNFAGRVIAIVNLEQLVRFEAGSLVDPAVLATARLVRGRFDAIKILGQGKLDRALTVRAHAFSKGAKASIEKAGGKAELVATSAPATPEPASEPATGRA